MATPWRRTDKPDLNDFLKCLNDADFDGALEAISQRQNFLKWRALPSKIVLVRHGQSEGNVNRAIYCSKGDALLELTPKGIEQSRTAGDRLKNLIGDDKIYVAVSPFERTQQTLLGMYEGGVPEEQVQGAQVSPQIREQEFGNFQSLGLHDAARTESQIVGRFYYRRPNAESSADVYDRVSAFWEDLIHNVLPKTENSCGTCLIITHGLTLRLILMKVFQWSVETFETVWNVGNCEHVTLTKNMDALCYQLNQEMSYPQNIVWATRPIWIVFKSCKASASTEERLNMLRNLKSQNDWGMLHAATESDEDVGQHANESSGRWLEIDRVIDQTENARTKERAIPYTVLDYLSLRHPRMQDIRGLDGHLALGHKALSRSEAQTVAKETPSIDWDDIEFVDWWGPRMSAQGKNLRTRVADSKNPMMMPFLSRFSSDICTKT